MIGGAENLADLEPGTAPWFGFAAQVGWAMLQHALLCDVDELTADARHAVQLRGPWREFLMTGWLDTLLMELGFTATQTPDGLSRENNAASLVFAGDDQQQVDVDDVAPLPRWAGRLLAARAALDVDTQRALLAAAPSDDPDDPLLAVLHLVTTTLQHHPTLRGTGATS